MWPADAFSLPWCNQDAFSYRNEALSITSSAAQVAPCARFFFFHFGSGLYKRVPLGRVVEHVGCLFVRSRGRRIIMIKSVAPFLHVFC